MTLAAIYRGDSKDYSLTFTDKAGAPVPLYGYKLYFTLKADEGDADLNAALQVVVTFPDDAESTAGRGVLSIAASETEGLEPGTYFYDFQLVHTVSGKVTTLAKNKVKVLADITRSTA